MLDTQLYAVCTGELVEERHSIERSPQRPHGKGQRALRTELFSYD